MRHPKETAFSLPEIAVALTILGILAVLVTPRAASFLVQARRGEAKVNLEHIKHLQAIYRVEHGSANSSAWEVGYTGAGTSKCDNTAAELFNPLGFNPKGCRSLRYSYYIDGTDYYAYGRSDHAGKWIYPDCEGGWTTKECGKKSGDLIRTSDSTSISVCRNIVEYCPTAHGGTPTPTPTTPTPTPTLCVSAGITCPTGKTLNTTRAGSTVAACCDCPDGSNIAGSCTCDNQVGTDKDTNSSVCRNAPNNGTWNGSETDLSKCCILPTPPKCSSLDLTRNNRDRNRDKDTDTFTNEIECYCPASSPKWDTTATPHPACAPTCDSLRTDGSRCISADYKGPPNSTVATNLSFKNTCCCPVGQHWDSDSSTCCVDADHDNNCDSCVAPKTGTPPTCVCPDIQPGDHSCEAWESWDTAASDCCSCSSGNVKVIGSDTVCCSTNTPTSCNGTWSFTGNKTNATCACTPYTCLGFTDCGSDQLKNPLPTINRTPTKELCCEAPNVPAPPEAPTCATFETRECTDTNTHKRAHLTWQNTDTSNPSQANCCKCIATEVTNDPAGLEVGINTKWCCKNQPSGADCAPPRKWHNTERSAPITAKYCECKCPNSKKFEGGQCVDTCKTIDAKDGVDCNNGSRKDESDQFTATIANFQTICCEAQDPLELKSCRAYVDDEQEKTGDEDGEGEEDGPLTPNAICGDGFLYGGAAVNDDTFEFNQAGDANADTENFTAFRNTCCRASSTPLQCSAYNLCGTRDKKEDATTYTTGNGAATCCCPTDKKNWVGGDTNKCQDRCSEWVAREKASDTSLSTNDEVCDHHQSSYTYITSKNNTLIPVGNDAKDFCCEQPSSSSCGDVPQQVCPAVDVGVLKRRGVSNSGNAKVISKNWDSSRSGSTANECCANKACSALDNLQDEDDSSIVYRLANNDKVVRKLKCQATAGVTWDDNGGNADLNGNRVGECDCPVSGQVFDYNTCTCGARQGCTDLSLSSSPTIAERYNKCRHDDNKIGGRFFVRWDFPNSRCLCLDNVGAIDSSKIFNYTSCQCNTTCDRYYTANREGSESKNQFCAKDIPDDDPHVDYTGHTYDSSANEASVIVNTGFVTTDTLPEAFKDTCCIHPGTPLDCENYPVTEEQACPTGQNPTTELITVTERIPANCCTNLCRDVPTTDSQRTACSATGNGCTWATSTTDTITNGCANCSTIKQWSWDSDTNTGACVCRGAKSDSDCKMEHQGDDNGVFWNTTSCKCECQTQADENGIKYDDTDNTATGLFCCPTGQIKHPSENRCCVADPDNPTQCHQGTPVQPFACCYLNGLSFVGLASQLLTNCCGGVNGGLGDTVCDGLRGLSTNLGIASGVCGNVGEHELIWRAYKEAKETANNICNRITHVSNIKNQRAADLVDAVKGNGMDACGSLPDTVCSPTGGGACQ